MAVFVDDMFKYPIGEFQRNGRTYKMSHLIASNTEELLAFATSLGLDTRWLQHPSTWKEHFDVTITVRKKAIAAGAIPCTMSQMGRLCRVRRQTGRLPDKLEELECPDR